MLGKTEGGRRGGRQRMRWLEGTTDSKGMLLLLLLSHFSRVQLCDPIDAVPSSTGPSPPRDGTQASSVSCIHRRVLLVPLEKQCYSDGYLS